MLFLVTWDFTDTSDEMQRRTLDLFSKWQPGPAVFQGFYGKATGDGGVAIAEALVISPRTVQHHLEHIYDKTGIRTRSAAAVFAVVNDLVDK